MIAPVDVTQVYFQVAMVWCLRQPLPLMIVYTQDYAVILATEVVSILWVLKVIEDSDLNDIVYSKSLKILISMISLGA